MLGPDLGSSSGINEILGPDLAANSGIEGILGPALGASSGIGGILESDLGLFFFFCRPELGHLGLKEYTVSTTILLKLALDTVIL